MLHLLITLESFWCSLSHLSYTHVVLCLCSTVLIICRVFLYSLFFFCYGYTWSSCYCPLSWFHPWVLMITVLSYLGMLRWIGPFYCLDHTYIYIYVLCSLFSSCPWCILCFGAIVDCYDSWEILHVSTYGYRTPCLYCHIPHPFVPLCESEHLPMYHVLIVC